MIHTKDNPKLVVCLDGELHRTDGPAFEYGHNGIKEWYLHGELHREDGPAYEDLDGYKSWYLNGEEYGEDNDFTTKSWIKFVKSQLLK